MRAVRCIEYGEPEGLIVADVEEPVAAAGEAVVEVRYGSINLSDIVLIRNDYQVPQPLPFTVGSELAGVVRSIGDGVESVAPGDLVYGAARKGAFAELAVVPADGLSVVPADTDLASAAGFGVAYTTAANALIGVAELAADETLVVLGAAGGVGLAAVELAKLMGARVIAVASTEAKLEVCRERGADEAVLSTDDVKARLKELGGADVVLDPVGGELADASLRSLGFGGRFVTVGYASGEIPRIALNLVLLKGIEIRGMDIYGYSMHRPEAAAAIKGQLHEWLVDGSLRPHVAAVYPLNQVVEAMHELTGRRAIGKVLLEMPAAH